MRTLVTTALLTVFLVSPALALDDDALQALYERNEAEYAAQQDAYQAGLVARRRADNERRRVESRLEDDRRARDQAEFDRSQDAERLRESVEALRRAETRSRRFTVTDQYGRTLWGVVE